jgi:hypothetical protein
VNAFLYRAISESNAFVLAQMLSPGIHQERFKKTVRGLKVPKDAPTIRAVATPNAAEFANGLEKFCLLPWIH